MMRRTTIEDTLQRCLERLDAGEDLAACLRDYPQHAAELAPLLEAAAALRHWEPPALSDTARERARLRARAALARQRARPRAWVWGWPSAAPRLAWAALALIVALFGMGGTVVAAQTSLPGDPLYGVKRNSEQLRLGLARDPGERAGLYLDFADRRLDETLALVEARRTPDPASLNELVRDYELAWQTLAQVDPARREDQIERYADHLREHRQRLTLALPSAAGPTERAILEGAVRANATATARLAEPPQPAAMPPATPTFVPTAAATDTAVVTSTPAPTRTPARAPVDRASPTVTIAEPATLPPPSATPSATETTVPSGATETTEPPARDATTHPPRPTDRPKPPKPTERPKPPKPPKPAERPKPPKPPKPTERPKPPKPPKRP